jgi:predicted metalloendopeptidase
VYTTYKRRVSKNKNYNDKSFVGNDHNGSYNIWWKKEDYQMFQNIQQQVKEFYYKNFNNVYLF